MSAPPPSDAWQNAQIQLYFWQFFCAIFQLALSQICGIMKVQKERGTTK